MKVVVGYFTNQYPKVSHSFIRREILALEQSGISVKRWALRGWDADLADAADVRERDSTEFLLQRGVAPLIIAALHLFVAHPLRWLSALRLSARMLPKSDRSLPKHAVSFLEAALLARQMTGAGVRHLHAHFGTNATEVAMVAAALADIPFSFTVHGPDEFDRPVATKLGLKIARTAFVVAITPFCASQLYRWCAHADWRKVKVVRCGLSPDFLDAAPAPFIDMPHFVSVGRLSGQKGQLLLIEALAMARSRGIPATLTLVGDGEMRGEVEAAIAHHRLTDAVTITGWAGEERVRAEIARARALVLASFAEGLPIVVMEALSLGRPVVATNVAAMADLVISGRTGWLVTPGSVESLADGLVDCASSSPERLVQMGQVGRDIVRDRHDAAKEALILAGLFADEAADGE